MTDIADKDPIGASPVSTANLMAGKDHPDNHPFRRFVLGNRASLGSLAVFILMMVGFMVASFASNNPGVFTDWSIYRAVLTGLPVYIFLIVPLVFVVTAGEIDLSFPATMGFSAWMFALLVQAGYDPFLGFAAAIVTGMVLGFGVGALVVYANLSSLIATLGMNFMLRGFILIVTEGKSIAMVTLNQSPIRTIFAGQVGGIPAQMLWAIAFILFSAYLYNRHRFGAHVHIVGDNPDAAQQMGIDVKRVRVKTFVFTGLGAALAGVFAILINFTWWPTAGEGYLLPVLASVFVGGTAPWGGIGTIIGSSIGGLTVSFIQTGVVAVGWSGFYTQFFYGLIIILSLLGHRWNQERYR